MATRKKAPAEPAETVVACENCRYFVPKEGRNEGAVRDDGKAYFRGQRVA